ncbi:MAG: hypothetical protein HKN60_02100 [Rhizobiales bacterium]|nr:hypothetical protein [Hyphomicrobiales bacterium]
MTERDLTLDQRAIRRATLTPEQRREMWISISPGITAEKFDEMQAFFRAREAGVPKPGDLAPDFKLDLLDRHRKRTGETVDLSSHRGKRPVALIFGSYT